MRHLFNQLPHLRLLLYQSQVSNRNIVKSFDVAFIVFLDMILFNKERSLFMQKITCPNCGCEISVDDVLHTQIESQVRQQYELQKAEDNKELEKLRSELSKKILETEQEKQNMDFKIADLVKQQLMEREKEIKKQAQIDAEAEQQLLTESLKKQLTDATNKLTESRKAQVALMEEKRKLNEDKEKFEIEKRKQLEAEREEIVEKAKKQAAEEQASIIAQKDKQIQDALKAKDELARKLEQGSQQTQGEVAELNLEDELRKFFIFDSIEPVPKGIRGADIIQKVRNNTNIDCGTIIWEVKNTKSWSDGWIPKLKEDQREAHADIAIIVSNVLPENINAFSLRDGVWVCSKHLAIPVAQMIRDKLEAINRERRLSVGKNEKMEILYNYLIGSQFRQRIEAVAESFSNMQKDLMAEKKYYEKKWAKTEKQIEQVIKNTVGIYGDLEGMVVMPKIQALELEYKE